LRESLSFPNRRHVILVGLLDPVRNLDRFPPRYMKVRSMTEDTVEQAGRRQKSISARLAEMSNTLCRDWLDLCGVTV
jgi:hypothetical protein